MTKLLIFTIFLSGCGGCITSKTIEEATEACKANGGIRYIVTGIFPFSSRSSVYCVNGMQKALIGK